MKSYNRDSLLWLAIQQQRDVEEIVLMNDDEEDDDNNDDRVNDIDDYLSEPLEIILKKETDVNSFLIIFGVIWVPAVNTNISLKWMNFAWNIVSRTVLILCPTLITLNIIFTSLYYKEAYVAVWGLDLLFIMQSLALSWSLISIKRRLMSISTHIEVSYFGKTLKYAVLYFSLNLFPTLLYPVVASLNAFHDPDRYSLLHLMIFTILPISELVILQLLSVHLLFILVDIQVLFSTFMKLYGINDVSHEDYSKKKVTLKEIHRRVKKTLYDTSPIIVTAIMEVVMLSIVQYFDDDPSNSIGSVTMLVYLFLKDIILVTIVFFMICYYIFNTFCKV